MKNKELEKLIEDRQAALPLIKVCLLDRFLRESMLLAYNLKNNK